MSFWVCIFCVKRSEPAARSGLSVPRPLPSLHPMRGCTGLCAGWRLENRREIGYNRRANNQHLPV